ncbi:MAG: hypothetical protein HOP16_18030 [Acidobacteria bacterium]|nr:hypothetical protein [Acidobacteriota bacterium]
MSQLVNRFQLARFWSTIPFLPFADYVAAEHAAGELMELADGRARTSATPKWD